MASLIEITLYCNPDNPLLLNPNFLDRLSVRINSS